MWTKIIVTYVTQCYEAFGNECMHILESFFLEY
jgi:hypothetical protein